MSEIYTRETRLFSGLVTSFWRRRRTLCETMALTDMNCPYVLLLFGFRILYISSKRDCVWRAIEVIHSNFSRR